MTLTFRTQAAEASIEGFSPVNDRDSSFGNDPASDFASVERSYDGVNGVTAANATITAQPTFENGFGLTGFFGAGNVSSASPLQHPFPSEATSTYTTFFTVNEATTFNLSWTNVPAGAWYQADPQNPFSDFVGGYAYVQFNTPNASDQVDSFNELGSFSKELVPGEYELYLTFSTYAIPDSPDAALDFFFIGSFADLTPAGLRWDEPTGGSFHTATNWEGDTLPGSDEDILFDLVDNYTVSLNEDTQAGNMSVANGRVNLNYGVHRLAVKDLAVAGQNGGTARLDIPGTSLVAPEHGIVAETITVGPGGTLSNGDRLFVGNIDFPFDTPEENQLLTTLQGLNRLTVEASGRLISPIVKVDGPSSSDGTGTATATVTGINSAWEAGFFEIGESRQGRVEVLDGGQLSSTAGSTESQLEMYIASGGPAFESVLLVSGVDSGGVSPTPSTVAVGRLRVGGDDYDNLRDGENREILVPGRRGKVIVNDGAQFYADFITLGGLTPRRDQPDYQPGGSGIFSLSGDGTRLSPSAGIVSTVIVGDGGYGQFDVLDGATAETNISIGLSPTTNDPNARGVATVDGTGSKITSSEFAVGQSGRGDLTVSNGGEVFATQSVFGSGANADGRVMVTGQNSKLTTTLTMDIGVAGEAVLKATQGASVLVNDVEEGALGIVRIGDKGVVEIESGSSFTTGTIRQQGKLAIRGSDSTVTTDFGYLLESAAQNPLTELTIDAGKLTVREDYFNLITGSVRVENAGVLEAGRWFIGPETEFVLDGVSSKVDVLTSLATEEAEDPTLGAGEAGVVGRLTVSNGARFSTDRLVVGPQGVVDGDGGVISAGVLANNGGFFNSGLLAQGASPGTLTIEGDFVQTETGRIIIEIGGQTPDTEYDQLIITGAAEINGTIVFEFIDGFLPSEGDMFDFLQVTGTTDLTDAKLHIEGLASGWEYDISPTAGGFQLLSLSDAQAIPEPASLLLVLAFAAAAVSTSHLRRS